MPLQERNLLSHRSPAGMARSLLSILLMKSTPHRRTYVHAFKETARKDPYRSKTKPKGTPRCPSCRAVSFRGRWLPAPEMKILHPTVPITSELKCPACKQLADQFALGVIELHGERWKRQKTAVLSTIRGTERIARHRNDQQRVLWIKDLHESAKVYVSLPELARQIGRVLENSFQGFIEYSRSTEEPYLRVRWWSDLPHGKHRPGRALHPSDPPIAAKSKAFRTRGEKN